MGHGCVGIQMRVSVDRPQIDCAWTIETESMETMAAADMARCQIYTNMCCIGPPLSIDSCHNSGHDDPDIAVVLASVRAH